MIIFWRRETCYNAWRGLRMTPLFGCFCPGNDQKKCERIYSFIYNNTCVGKFNSFYFDLIWFETFLGLFIYFTIYFFTASFDCWIVYCSCWVSLFVWLPALTMYIHTTIRSHTIVRNKTNKQLLGCLLGRKGKKKRVRTFKSFSHTLLSRMMQHSIFLHSHSISLLRVILLHTLYLLSIGTFVLNVFIFRLWIICFQNSNISTSRNDLVYNFNSKSSCIRWKFSPNYTYLHVSHYFIKIATDWVCYHWFLYFWLSYFIFILLIIFFPSPPPIFSVGWLHPAMIF